MTELHYKDAVHWAQCLNVRLKVRTHQSLQFLILTMCLIIWFSQVHQFYIKTSFSPRYDFCITAQLNLMYLCGKFEGALQHLSYYPMEQLQHVTHQHQNPLHDITMHVSPSLVRALTAHSGTIRLKKTKQKKYSARQFLRKSNVGMRIYQSVETSDQHL